MASTSLMEDVTEVNQKEDDVGLRIDSPEEAISMNA